MENDRQKLPKATLKQYLTGFVLSLLLTLTAYVLVREHVRSGHAFLTDNTMLTLLSILAISQLIAQLVFFLHLSRESKPRWNLLVLSFAAIVVVIVVGGSLWIMSNLGYHHDTRTPTQTDQAIIKDEGVSQ